MPPLPPGGIELCISIATFSLNAICDLVGKKDEICYLKLPNMRHFVTRKAEKLLA